MYPPVSTPLLPVDWHEQLLDGNGRLATFGGDPWPYGVEANRPTLEALVRYMAEQSLIKAPIPVEELFVPIYGQ